MKTFKINIYTIEGCEACAIMKRIVTDAAEDYVYVSTYVINIPTNDNTIAKENNIKDYPTTRMVDNNNNILWELVGTYPKDYVQQCIDKSIDALNEFKRTQIYARRN